MKRKHENVKESMQLIRMRLDRTRQESAMFKFSSNTQIIRNKSSKWREKEEKPIYQIDIESIN